MSEDMNLSVNGQSQVPPGFRFHPTEEELLHYYLRKKVAFEKIDFNVIRDVDLNKLEPWDIQERCKIGSTPQNDWYFFSHKDKKYPTGTRTNRATAAGFWKATGRDKVIFSSSRRIGMRKTLVFYKGRAPHGQKSDWIMHEYRLDENNNNSTIIHDNIVSNLIGDSVSEEGWVVCRVFKKKNYHKALESPHIASSSSSIENNNNNNNNNQRNQLLQNSAKTGAVWDQILHLMGRTSSCKQELDQTGPHIITNPIITSDIMHLPRLESPTIPSSFYNDHQSMDEIFSENNGDWAAYDRFVASQLNGNGPNGGNNHNNDNFCFPVDHNDHELTRHQHNTVVDNGDMDMWNYAQSSSPSSSSDPLCHLSV